MEGGCPRDRFLPAQVDTAAHNNADVARFDEETSNLPGGDDQIVRPPKPNRDANYVRNRSPHRESGNERNTTPIGDRPCRLERERREQRQVRLDPFASEATAAGRLMPGNDKNRLVAVGALPRFVLG